MTPSLYEQAKKFSLAVKFVCDMPTIEDVEGIEWKKRNSLKKSEKA